MRKNDEIQIEITGYTSAGAGVGRYEKMAVFTPNTAIGDLCLVRIIKTARTYAIGKLIEVLRPSPDRVKALCPVFSKCGGCSFWHISYEAELAAKRQGVQDAITRLGGLSFEVGQIVGAPFQTGYRNKAAFPVSTDRDGKAIFGFFAQNSHRVVPCEACLIQNEKAVEIARAVCDFANENALSVYDEKSGKGLLRHIFVRTAADKRAILCLVINGSTLPRAEKFIEFMRRRIDGLCGITLCPNTKNTNVIMGERLLPLWGSMTLCDTLCGNEYEISPLSFYQVNHDQCERLYNLALDMAQIEKDDVVFDLYCGIGTMTQLFARRAKHVYGVEIVPSAVENATAAAKKNGFENITFVCGDAPKTAAELKKKGIIPDVVVVDPPRAGLGGTLVEDIAGMYPSRVVYVSCNPATLARDLKQFEALSYTAKEIIPVDMFPRTPHCEVACLLCKQAAI